MALSLTSTAESRREAGLDPPQPSADRWRHFLWLLTRYWRSSDWKLAWLLLAANIGAQFTGVYSSLLLNRWQRDFFNAIQAVDGAAIPGLLWSFAIVVCFAVTYGAVVLVVQNTLQIRWRTWLTHDYLERWLRHQRFYDIERTRLIDNPDQRIADDIRLLTEQSINLFMGFILAVTSAITFGILLWGLSGIFYLAIAGAPLELPGTLVWAAIGYAIIGGIVIVLAGKPLVRKTMRQQHYEADYRFALIHVRRNSEQIAFARSASTEWRGLGQAFDLVRRNFIQLIWIRCGIQSIQGVYSYVSQIVPLLIMLPRILAREITLGQLMQGRDAFAQFSLSLSWFVQAYPQIAEMTATVNRLKALDDAMESPRPYRIANNRHSLLVWEARDLHIELPNGEKLLDVGDWTIRPGERWTVQGPSGTGKSTLLRALAGIWPDGSGTINSPAAGRIMFVPQKAYFPLGSLKDAICFPADPSAFDDARIIKLLELCRLPRLQHVLHEIRPWADELSPGEQQRLAMARVLLHAPDYLVLDEATSALDADNAAHLYSSVLSALPGLTLVSVVHAEALTRFHTHSFSVVDRRAVLATTAS